MSAACMLLNDLRSGVELHRSSSGSISTHASRTPPRRLGPETVDHQEKIEVENGEFPGTAVHAALLAEPERTFDFTNAGVRIAGAERVAEMAVHLRRGLHVRQDQCCGTIRALFVAVSVTEAFAFQHPAMVLRPDPAPCEVQFGLEFIRDLFGRRLNHQRDDWFGLVSRHHRQNHPVIADDRLHDDGRRERGLFERQQFAVELSFFREDRGLLAFFIQPVEFELQRCIDISAHERPRSP